MQGGGSRTTWTVSRGMPTGKAPEARIHLRADVSGIESTIRRNASVGQQAILMDKGHEGGDACEYDSSPTMI